MRGGSGFVGTGSFFLRARFGAATIGTPGKANSSALGFSLAGETCGGGATGLLIGDDTSRPLDSAGAAVVLVAHPSARRFTNRLATFCRIMFLRRSRSHDGVEHTGQRPVEPRSSSMHTLARHRSGQLAKAKYTHTGKSCGRRWRSCARHAARPGTASTSPRPPAWARSPAGWRRGEAAQPPSR